MDLSPNQVLTPLKSTSKKHMSSFVHPSKIFVWGAYIYCNPILASATTCDYWMWDVYWEIGLIFTLFKLQSHRFLTRILSCMLPWSVHFQACNLHYVYMAIVWLLACTVWCTSIFVVFCKQILALKGLQYFYKENIRRSSMHLVCWLCFVNPSLQYVNKAIVWFLKCISHVCCVL